MIACPGCGFEAPDDFAFCPKCATPLSAPSPIADERKVVSTLFCDLVAFTAMSEAADPEDIDAILRQYHAAARKVIESHGGTVEKFIGDAVVGVFGVPAVHEDDPERAVRAGLCIVEALEGMTRPDGNPLQVRVGVNTGEALVRLDVDPASGRGFLTGDAVNVAARLEAAAPPGGVAVGPLTHQLSARVVRFEQLPPVNAKGKSEPVPAWLATRTSESRSRTGRRTTGGPDTPFLGRDKELRHLLDAFETASSTCRAQSVLLVGEPGIGKSRLVLEFARALDERPEPTIWRQGHCLAYGDNIGFAALSEVLKAHAEILDSDDVPTLERKLELVLPDGENRPWLRQRLRALLGLEASHVAQEESFVAWTLFLRRLASSRPMVLVLEDLHWAGEGMLAFIEHLAMQGLDVPLIVVTTTRPELLQRHPQLLASGDEATKRLILAPLTRRDSDRLLTALLNDRLASDVRAPIVERIGGNPLYAEEYVRLLLDRGLLLTTGSELQLRKGEELPLPDTVQAVLAARLDTLPTDHKALLCDAAVFGERFWGGAVAALADRGAEEVSSAMMLLTERQLVRPAVSSSFAGQREYLFWHALARDVAYAEIPKRSRVHKHASAAAWLEAQAGEHLADLADVLAYHYVTALELAEGLRETSLREPLVEPSLRCLDLAGTTALPIDVGAAKRYLRRALELAPPEARQRPRILAHWAIAAYEDGQLQESASALEVAVAQLKAAGELRPAAEALIHLGGALSELGLPDSAARGLEALALLEGDEPSEELAFVLRNTAMYEGNLGRPERARNLAERALECAALLGFSARGGEAEGARHYCGALMARGSARCQLGDPGGLDDLREASEAAVAGGSGAESVVNFGVNVCVVQGPCAALPIYDRCLGLCRDRGMRHLELWTLAALLAARLAGGLWDDVLSTCDELTARLEAAEAFESLTYAKTSLALLHARRGDWDLARPLAAWALARARGGDVPVDVAFALVAAATAGAAADNRAARGFLEELPDHLDASFAFFQVYDVPQMLRTSHLNGAAGLAEQLTAWIEPLLPSQRFASTYGRALLAEACHEHEAAAAGFATAVVGWRTLGVPYEEAQALLGQGRCLVALGRAPEAAEPLDAARDIFARLGAKPALEETDALILQP